MMFADGIGFSVEGLSYSPITGPKGNIEFLLYMKKCSPKKVSQESDFAQLAEEIAKNAHSNGELR